MIITNIESVSFVRQSVSQRKWKSLLDCTKESNVEIL